MKPIILSVLLLTTIFVHSQDSLRLLSKFEQFATKKGVVKKVESARIGYLTEAEITLQKVSNPGGGSRMAVVLARPRTNPAAATTAYALYFDHDELDDICIALDRFLEESKKKEAPKNDPYYMYTTNNNMVISLVYLNFEAIAPGWYITVSQRYADSGSTVPGSVVTVKTNEIDGFVLSFKNAKRVKDL